MAIRHVIILDASKRVQNRDARKVFRYGIDIHIHASTGFMKHNPDILFGWAKDPNTLLIVGTMSHKTAGVSNFSQIIETYQDEFPNSVVCRKVGSSSSEPTISVSALQEIAKDFGISSTSKKAKRKRKIKGRAFNGTHYLDKFKGEVTQDTLPKKKKVVTSKKLQLQVRPVTAITVETEIKVPVTAITQETKKRKRGPRKRKRKSSGGPKPQTPI